MKRKAADSQQASRVKRQKEAVPEYCDTACLRDGEGNILWPAGKDAVSNARDFLKEW